MAISPNPEIPIEQLVRELHATADSDQTRSRIGEEKFNALYEFVERLLRGESFPRSEVIAAGLDPQFVLTRASRQRIAHFDEIGTKLRNARRIRQRGRALF